MSQKRLGSTMLALLLCLATLTIAQPALACSVCFGDPNSQMAQGVQAGVLVLLGVVGVVLTGLASLLLFWMRRAAHLEEVEEVSQAALSASRAPFSTA